MAQLEVGSPGSSGPADGAPALTRRAIWHVRSLRRPRWWQEIIFIGVSYALYSAVRNLVPDHRVAALHRAKDVLQFETDIHINVERSINKLFASQHWLAYAASYWYGLLHFIVTIGVLVWLYTAHPLRYRPIRTVLYTATLLGLVGFWLVALAPPRMLPGFVDTVDIFPTVWGSWNTAGVATISNQFAAMPSLHIAWSTWCGLTIFMLAKHTWVRVLGIAYPILTLVVILGTANHFLLDAVGGLLVLAAGFGITRVMFGRGAFASLDRAKHLRSWRRQTAGTTD